MTTLAARARRLQLPSIGRLRSWLTQLMFWVLLVFVALFLGLVCAYLPWWLVAGAVLALAYPLLLWFAPWVGLGVYSLALIVSPDFKYLLFSQYDQSAADIMLVENFR